MTILQGLELVSETIALGNRALRDTIHTVHLHRIELTNTVPVNRRSVGIVVILDVDHNLVTPACLDQGAGERLVEDLAAGLFESIRC